MAVFHTSPLEQVHEGMTVVDAQEKRLGKVKRLRMGDPQATTTAGQGDTAGGIAVAVAPASNPGATTGTAGLAPLAESIDEPDVPDPLRTRLRRVGFIELEDSDLHGADAYIAGDRISQVRDDVVHLQTPEATMPPTSVPTQAGMPHDVTHGSSALSRERVTAAAAAGLALACVGGALGLWQYRQRQHRQQRLDARVQRWVGSVRHGLYGTRTRRGLAS